jgi:hypothetical protein
MLPTRTIPQYQDKPSDWRTFLDKASKGSIKALDTLSSANMAYMVALTSDPTAPETMQLDDYNMIVRERFPVDCPIASLQDFHDIALDHGWFAKPFRVSERQRHEPAAYRALWGRSTVAGSSLMNDAMLHCLEGWSANHLIECVDHYGADYDSRVVATAMLYLSSTWPGV